MLVLNRGIGLLLVLTILTGLSACGGGGGGGSTPPGTDASLNTLTITDVVLDQAFDPSQTTYTSLVGYLVDSVFIDGIPSDTEASIEVNGTVLSAEGLALELAEGSNLIEFVVTAEDGSTTETYMVTVTRQPASSFAQDAYIKASNTESNDNFGWAGAVALDGDTLVVGTYFEDSNGSTQSNNSAESAGAVYVFTRDDAGLWSQQVYLKASNAEAGDWFGYSVALNGDTLAIGAIGENGDGTNESDNSRTGPGAVYVFARDSVGVWNQQQYLKASNVGNFDSFGSSLALEGDTLVVGALGESGNGVGGATDNSAFAAGAAYVFTRNGAGLWSEQAYLKASNAGAGDEFGSSVAISGDTIAVAALREDSNGVGGEGDNSADRAGAVYVYARNSAGDWDQQAYLKASNAETEDVFGSSIALEGDTLVVGAPEEDGNGVDGEADNSGNDAGAVYVFTRNGSGTWSQQQYLKLKLTDVLSNGFGFAVALKGNKLAVTAPGDRGSATGVNGDQSDTSASRSGAAYLYTRDSMGVWSQPLYLKASNTQGGDNFGLSIAFAGDTIAIAAPGEDSAATGVDGDQADNSANEAGAVYLIGGKPSRDPELSSLSLDGFALDQVFQPTQQDYTASVGYLATSVALNLTTDDPVTVRINGEQFGVAGTDFSGLILPLVTGINDFNIEITAEDGETILSYTLSITRDTAASFAQRAYIKASNAGSGDEFSRAVALDGDTLVVGALEEASDGSSEADDSAAGAGAAYVFTRDGSGVWSQQAYLKASNVEAGDGFGNSVAISGDTIAVGAWLEDSDGTSEGDNNANNSGAAYVFTRDSMGVWSQQQYLKASNAETDDQFGYSISLSGDRLAVGARLEDSDGSSEADNNAADAGAVYVFTRDGSGVWTQEGYLKASNADASDQFGWTVALSGDFLAVGAYLEDSSGNLLNNNATNSGAVYVFRRSLINDNAFWGLGNIVKASGNPDNDDQFGYSIALSGDTLAVGANLEDGDGSSETDNSAADSGAVYIFTRGENGLWPKQQYLKASNAGAGDGFGSSITLSGDTLVVGAWLEDSDGSSESDDSAVEAGAAYVFTRDESGVWTQQSYLKASNVEAAGGDRFGSSVALSGDTLAIGARFEDSDGSSESDNSAADAGAVYVSD